MNKRIQKLAEQARLIPVGQPDGTSPYMDVLNHFAELIIQECANYIRENYDSWDAEPLAHNLEVDFGLHGDYAE